MEVKLDIKPLSVNQAFKGKKFKTPEYTKYEKKVLYMLPKVNIPLPPYEIHFVFGFSSKASDLSNPTKLIEDILCKKYKFDDRHVSRIVLDKAIVPKGKEFIKIKILTYNK
jgi:Holliday junction resolvase RusA-like endonuclease